MKQQLVVVLSTCMLLVVLLGSQTVSAQPSSSFSPSISWTNSVSWTSSLTQTWTGSNSYTQSTSWSPSQSWSVSGSYSQSVSWSGSQSYSTSWTSSFTLTTSVSASWSYSGSISAGTGYPQITGITNTINDFTSVNLVWNKPVGFAYQSYQVFLIVNGTSITFDNIPTENLLLTTANTNGLIQPGQSYFVQVRGFLNGSYGPQSLPVTVSTNGGDVYGPVGTDPTSVNNLQCNYFPQNLRCQWNTGSRLWLNATFYVQCNRTVTPIQGAMAWIVQKVLNTAGSTTLPTLAVIPLPSGCRCQVDLTVFYSTPVVRVDLILTNAPTGLVNTDKSNLGKPNTPLTVPLP